MTRVLSALAVLGLLVGLLMVAPPSHAAGKRTVFLFDGMRRSLKDEGRSWVEIENGRVTRSYVEKKNTARYIELYTASPRPTIVRVYDDHIEWKLASEAGWRQGARGRWARR